MASVVYDIAKLGFTTGQLQWNSNQIWKVLLAYSTYTPNAATHQHVSDITSGGFEVSGSGYTPGISGSPGRFQLSSFTATPAAGDIVQLSASTPSWNNINVSPSGQLVRWVVVHMQAPANLDTASILACAIDITGVITNGGNLTIQWSSNGIMTVS